MAPGAEDTREEEVRGLGTAAVMAVAVTEAGRVAVVMGVAWAARVAALAAAAVMDASSSGVATAPGARALARPAVVAVVATMEEEQEEEGGPPTVAEAEDLARRNIDCQRSAHAVSRRHQAGGETRLLPQRASLEP